MTLETTSRAEVINGDADDTRNTVAHDTQMRHSPSFLPQSTQVCVETDVNRPKEKGQPVMEGTQLRSAQQTSSQATRQALELERKSSRSQSLRDLVHRGGRLRGSQSRRGEKAAVQEYLSDVCDDVVNGEEHKNQCGFLPSVTWMSPSSHSMLSTRAENSSLCQRERGGKDQNTAEKVVLEKATTAGRVHSFRERHDRDHGKGDRWFKRYQCQ